MMTPAAAFQMGAAAFNMALASSSSGATTSAQILEQAGALLTWALTQFTAIITWMTGNPYGILLLVMFIVGFAVALLARVLYSL